MVIKTFIWALCLVASQLYATEFGDIPATTDVSTLWVPPARTLTIGGSTLSLSADRAWTATTILDSISSTQGVVLYRGASAWSALSPGTDGSILTTHGASANPTWSPAPAAGAPTTAHYVTTQAESGLSAEFSLGSLGSGNLKQSVSSSISTPAIAASADIIGLFSTCSGTQYLGADGSCHTPTSITPAALTKTDDTNVTLTLGGTPSTALLQATSITAGWTGTLGVSRRRKRSRNINRSGVRKRNVSFHYRNRTVWDGGRNQRYANIDEQMGQAEIHSNASSGSNARNQHG